MAKSRITRLCSDGVGVAKRTFEGRKWTSDGPRGCVLMGGAHSFLNSRDGLAKCSSEGRKMDFGRIMFAEDFMGMYKIFSPNFANARVEALPLICS